MGIIRLKSLISLYPPSKSKIYKQTPPVNKSVEPRIYICELPEFKITNDNYCCEICHGREPKISVVAMGIERRSHNIKHVTADLIRKKGKK